MSRENDIKKLIEINYRHLQKLKEQAAKFGTFTPPHILVEIEDKEAEIEALQKELVESEEFPINTSRQATNIDSDVTRLDKIINVYQSLPATENLEIVDIAFQDELQSNGQIVLDIKLRNASSQVAFIKSAEIIVHKIWQLSPSYQTGALILPSANYDLEIPIKEVPYSVESSVSQAISPNGVDRFTLTLSCPPHYVILAQLTLIYDSDNKSLSSDNLIFAKHGSSCSYPTMTIEELTQTDKEASRLNHTWRIEQWREYKEAVIQNNSVREQIKTIAGVRNKTIQDLEVI